MYQLLSKGLQKPLKAFVVLKRSFAVVPRRRMMVRQQSLGVSVMIAAVVQETGLGTSGFVALEG
jgi:hypothetical protein